MAYETTRTSWASLGRDNSLSTRQSMLRLSLSHSKTIRKEMVWSAVTAVTVTLKLCLKPVPEDHTRAETQLKSRAFPGVLSLTTQNNDDYRKMEKNKYIENNMNLTLPSRNMALFK